MMTGLRARACASAARPAGAEAPPRLAHRLDAFGRRLPAVACWVMAEFSRVEASRKGCLRPGLPGGAMFSLPWRWFPPIGAPGGMARLLRVREAAGASYVPGGRESWRQPVGGSRNSNSGQLCSRTRQYGERLVQPRRSMTCLSELYFSASSIEAPRFSNAMAKRRWRAGPRGRTGSRRRPSAGRGPRTAGSARWPTPTAPPTSRDVAGPSRGLEARGKTDRFNSERLWRCPWFEWGLAGEKVVRQALRSESRHSPRPAPVASCPRSPPWQSRELAPIVLRNERDGRGGER